MIGDSNQTLATMDPTRDSDPEYLAFTQEILDVLAAELRLNPQPIVWQGSPNAAYTYSAARENYIAWRRWHTAVGRQWRRAWRRHERASRRWRARVNRRVLQLQAHSLRGS